MKTSIKTIFATGLIALAISSSTVSANEKVGTTTISSNAVNVSTIQRVIISGDVEVTIAQNAKSKVLFTNDGDVEVSVKKVGNSLYVNSKGATKGGKITVYVADIYRLVASGNAVVQTKDALTLKYLQVYLNDHAKLELNSKTEGLYTSIKSDAQLTLKGMTDAYNIEMDKTARITLDRFVSKKTDMSATDVYVAARR